MNYPGKELEIFDKAHFWRNYTYLLVKKFIGKKILEVGAGLGSFTKVYIKEKSYMSLDNFVKFKNSIIFHQIIGMMQF